MIIHNRAEQTYVLLLQLGVDALDKRRRKSWIASEHASPRSDIVRVDGSELVAASTCVHLERYHYRYITT
jgi:hypothetical protein